MEFVHSCGLQPDEETSKNAVKSGNLKCLTYLARVNCPMNGSELSKIATENGFLDILKFLHEQNCYLLTDQLFLSAVEFGRLDCVEFLLNNNAANYNERALAYASTGGHLEILQYLTNNGFKATTDSPCNSAAAAGYLDCLKHLIELGSPWSEGTFLYASTHDSASILHYLHENCGSHFNEQAAHAASLSGRVNCLKYLLSNGCDYDEDSCLSALRIGKKNNHRECMAYLHKRKMNGESNTDGSNSPTSVTVSHSVFN